LNGRNIPFVNHVKYLGVIFDNRITWRLHLEMIEAKAFRTFTRIYSLFKRDRLRANIEVILHKALIRFVMTYVCSSCELTADTYLLNCSAYKTRFSASTENFQGAHRSTICTRRHSNFRMYTIVPSVHCAGLLDVQRASQNVVSADTVGSPRKLKLIHSMIT
jgi:hypothetical protein